MGKDSGDGIDQGCTRVVTGLYEIKQRSQEPIESRIIRGLSQILRKEL